MTSDLGRWQGILGELARRREFSQSMGGPERLEKHRANGKLDARQRIELLFDPGTFVEIGAFAAGLTESSNSPAPADGLVAGFGLIDGRPALAGAEDFTVQAGSIGDAGADKRYRLTELAAQERVPLIFMLERAGHRLTNAHAGRGPNDLQGLADLSGTVPMACLVMGPSAGHGALTAPLSDFVVMTEAASLFTAGPPLVKAAIGEVVTKEQLGGPQVHVAVSGVAHSLAADDAAAIAMARRYLSYFPSNAWEAPPHLDGPDTGPRRLDDILSIVDPDPRIPFAMTQVLELLADAGSLFAVQPSFGASLITALARIGGHSVAIVANDPSVRAGAVDSDAADKAAHFLDVANAFHLPVVFLTDTPGVMAGTAAEKSGVLRHAARMFAAQHRLSVPKLHVTLRKAFGFGSSIMAMNPFDNQTISLAFPAITLGAMPAASGAAAAKLDAAARAKAEADQAGGAYQIAGKIGYDDIIDPRDLRNALLHGLALTEKRSGPLSPVLTGGIAP
jgi:acetyl-CoA carboxylase carboxyltransferase component